MVISFGKNGVAPNELLSNLKQECQREAERIMISKSFSPKQKEISFYHWIRVEVSKYNLFEWSIVDSSNISRLQNSTLHHLHCISIFACVDCCTSFDSVLKKDLASLC